MGGPGTAPPSVTPPPPPLVSGGGSSVVEAKAKSSSDDDRIAGPLSAAELVGIFFSLLVAVALLGLAYRTYLRRKHKVAPTPFPHLNNSHSNIPFPGDEAKDPHGHAHAHEHAHEPAHALTSHHSS